LHGVASISALKKIVDESKLISTVRVDADACKCLLRKTHGLPCAHELAEYDRANMPIPANCFDRHWKKLDISPSAPSDNEAVDLEKHLVDEFELINQRFASSCC